MEIGAQGYLRRRPFGFAFLAKICPQMVRSVSHWLPPRVGRFITSNPRDSTSFASTRLISACGDGLGPAGGPGEGDQRAGERRGRSSRPSRRRRAHTWMHSQGHIGSSGARSHTSGCLSKRTKITPRSSSMAGRSGGGIMVWSSGWKVPCDTDRETAALRARRARRRVRGHRAGCCTRGRT